MKRRVKGIDIREILFSRSMSFSRNVRFHLGRIPRSLFSAAALMTRATRDYGVCVAIIAYDKMENEAVRIMLIIVQPNCSFRGCAT